MKHIDGIEVERNSSFELLRIICILGIIIMHTYGVFGVDATGANLISGVFINSIFNSGVSIFMLISGYFGVRTSKRKILRLWFQVWIFSLLSTVININWYESSGTAINLLKTLRNMMFPISVVRYWYITCYFLLLIFADYINMASEKLPKKKFQTLILYMVIVFSFLPTVTFSHVFKDGGKGFANMLLMYFIGRYIKLYGKALQLKKTIKYASIVFGIELSLNMIFSFVVGGLMRRKGIFVPFAQDCSLFIIVLAVGVFESFRQIKFQSKVINRIAKHVLGVYLLESSIRKLLNQYIFLSIWKNTWYLIFIIFIYALVVFLIAAAIDFIYKFVEGRCFDKIFNIVNPIIVHILQFVSKRLNIGWIVN